MFRKFQAVTTIAMNITEDHKSRLANFYLGDTSYIKTSTIKIRLHTGNPGVNGTANLVSGNGYAHATYSNTSTGFDAAVSGSKTNKTSISFPAATGSGWGEIQYWSITDADTNVMYYGAFSSPKTVTAGDIFTIAAESLTVTVS